MFWSNMRLGYASGCWRWDGPVAGGFGVWCGVRAHRVAYALARGRTVPARVSLGHACGDSLCVNPGHLVLAPDLAGTAAAG